MKNKLFVRGCLLILFAALVGLAGCATPGDPNVPVPQEIKLSLVPGYLGDMKVEWEPVPGAASYIVQYGSGRKQNQTSGPITGTSWTARDLNIFQADPFKDGGKDVYKFSIVVITEDGRQSRPSKPVNGMVLVAPVTDVTVTPAGRGQLIVRWTHLDEASHVNIRWGTADNLNLASGRGDTFENPDGQGEFIIGGLRDNTAYYVWLQACAVITQNEITEWYDGAWTVSASGTTISQ